MPLKAIANMQEGLVLPLNPDEAISANYGCSDVTRKLFSLGRGIGASYYHLVDLSDRSRSLSFDELEQEYSQAFQNLNIIDIILNDIDIQGKARYDLNNIRRSFYNALRDQDLSETKLAFVRDTFVIFYENLSQEINRSYSCKGSWLLSLGFYTSFQLESLSSAREEKILLSGFQKIMNKRTVAVPQHIYENLTGIYKLDKPFVTQADLINLERNLTSVIGYFTTYPDSQPLFREVQEVAGVWQGILFNPNNKRYDIRLIVNEDLTASMDIEGIANNVMISDVRIVNNYFTFMFKPFGTEKLYMRFNAKLTENIFTGEITDVIGEKGYWVLARTDENLKLSEDKINTMVSYIEQIEEKIKNSEAIVAMVEEEVEKLACEEIKPDGETVSPELPKETAKVPETEIIPTVNDEEVLELLPVAENQVAEIEEELEKIKQEVPLVEVVEKKPVVEESVEEQEKAPVKEKKNFVKKLKSLLKRLFSFVKLV